MDNKFNEKRNDFLRKAEELIRENHLNDVLDCTEEWLMNFPADVDALAARCEALIGLNRLEEMRKLLNDVAETIGGFNLINERAGDACREKGYHREAAACYERFLSLRPDAERSGEIIGKMAFLEQEDTCAEAVPTNDTNASETNFFTITMAQLYIEQGHFYDAQIILEEIINKEPENAHALAILETLKIKISKESFKNDHLIKILSSWLKNIERLKDNAATG